MEGDDRNLCLFSAFHLFSTLSSIFADDVTEAVSIFYEQSMIYTALRLISRKRLSEEPDGVITVFIHLEPFRIVQR